MGYTPGDIEQVLEQVREILLRWDNQDKLGEIAILVGGQEYRPEERPRERGKAVKRETRRISYVDKING